MTVPWPSGSLPVAVSADVAAERVLGPQAAKRLATFGNGVRYVKAGGWKGFLAWLVDFVVFVLGVGVSVIVVAGVGRAVDLDNRVLPVGVIAVLFLVPLLYGGLCYRDGRALGAVLTGSRLVRTEDGGRIGGRAPWTMLVRVLMPVLVIGVIIGTLGGGGSAPGGSTAKVSVDARATRRLHTAGAR